MVYKVELLSKEKWKNYILDNGYRSEEYYDVELSEDSLHNINLKLTRKKPTNPIVHISEEYDFPDKLYQDYFHMIFLINFTKIIFLMLRLMVF